MTAKMVKITVAVILTTIQFYNKKLVALTMMVMTVTHKLINHFIFVKEICIILYHQSAKPYEFIYSWIKIWLSAFAYNVYCSIYNTANSIPANKYCLSLK